jgi:hypothetical protein
MRLRYRLRYALYAVFSTLFLSGAVWLVADGLKDTSGGETWQAISANLLMLHGGAAMVTLMLLGALLPVHVSQAWRAKRNRLTGGATVALNAILIVTAFGLYYLGSELLRPWTSNIHLAAGFSLPIFLFVHSLRGRLAKPGSQNLSACPRSTGASLS